MVHSKGSLTMEIRTTWSKLTFQRSFSLPGSDAVFPAGDYDFVIEEARLQGLTFDAYRRINAFLEVVPDPRFPSQTELRPVTDADLKMARRQVLDPAVGSSNHTDADSAPLRERP